MSTVGGERGRERLRQLGWFVLLWVAGVSVVATVAALLRWILL